MNEQTPSSLRQDASLHLWHLIILNEGTTFVTAGRGSRPGIEFTYEISRSRRAADITTLERAYPATATSCGS